MFASVKCSKLPRRNLLFKHMIQLFKGPPLRLWQAEVGPNTRDDRETTKDESCLAAEISLIRINHIRHNDSHNESPEILCEETYTHAIRAETSRGHLSTDDVPERTKGKIVEEVPDDDQCGLAPGNRMVVIWYDVENTDDEHDDGENNHAGE